MSYQQSCDFCDGNGGWHDCGEDVCCCLDPEPNILCDECFGSGDIIIDED